MEFKATFLRFPGVMSDWMLTALSDAVYVREMPRLKVSEDKVTSLFEIEVETKDHRVYQAFLMWIMERRNEFGQLQVSVPTIVHLTDGQYEDSNKISYVLHLVIRSVTGASYLESGKLIFNVGFEADFNISS